MHPDYQIADPSTIASPALIFSIERIRHNLDRMLQIAGRADRLRPHAKTHKTREIIQLERDAGIDKHKCATIAEADLLAEVGVRDILLAYPLVGPNCQRFARLAQLHPQVTFSTIVDDPETIGPLSRACAALGQVIDVLIDVDLGQRRTGIAPGDAAERLYQRIAQSPGLRPGGIHAYDGHIRIEDPVQRSAQVRQQMEPVLALRSRLLAQGLPVPRLVLGGTPTFPAHAGTDLPGVELSPGTCVLHDHGYASRFPDLGMQPAAFLLTRVVSRPTPNRITLDLGTKAVASDPPMGQRCRLLDLSEARQVLHNEEHLVIECDQASQFRPGDVVYAIPTHVCPTCALHKWAWVVDRGQVVDRWAIVARDRQLRV